MREAGGLFKDGGVFKPNVCVAGNLMTGQNPPSAGPLAVQVCYFYDPIRGEFEPPRQALLAERAILVSEIDAAKAGEVDGKRALDDASIAVRYGHQAVDDLVRGGARSVLRQGTRSMSPGLIRLGSARVSRIISRTVMVACRLLPSKTHQRLPGSP